MLPIVSSIIVGQGGYGGGPASQVRAAAARSRATGAAASRAARGFALAASYSFGMAVVYTAFGVAAGLAGEGLAAALQNPWVLGAFALGLVALSLSMFGVYELQMPSCAGRPLHRRRRRSCRPAASPASARWAASRRSSSAPASPRRSPARLLYLSQTRDVWLGGTALFSLAAGMSVPLLLVGASAGALLPRAGAWMVEVKAAFGVLLLGVALWTVQPVLPGPLALALWGVLALGAAALLVQRASLRRHAPAPSTAPTHASLAPRGRRAARPGRRAADRRRGVGRHRSAAAARPLLGAQRRRRAAGRRSFAAVRSVDELDAALRTAGRPVMLDFYADWCVSCKEMERFTFTDAAVQKKLAGALLLNADVTANNAAGPRAAAAASTCSGRPARSSSTPSGSEVARGAPDRLPEHRGFLETLRRAGL